MSKWIKYKNKMVDLSKVSSILFDDSDQIVYFYIYNDYVSFYINSSDNETYNNLKEYIISMTEAKVFK